MSRHSCSLKWIGAIFFSLTASVISIDQWSSKKHHQIHHIAGLYPQVSDSVDLSRSARICISNTFPGNAGAACPGSTF